MFRHILKSWSKEDRILIISVIMLTVLTILNFYSSLKHSQHPSGEIKIDTSIYLVNDMDGETVNKP